MLCIISKIHKLQLGSEALLWKRVIDGCCIRLQTPDCGYHEQHVARGGSAPHLPRAAAAAVQRGEERPSGAGLHQLPPCHRP